MPGQRRFVRLILAGEERYDLAIPLERTDARLSPLLGTGRETLR
jgi:hypothetical protein